jgi:tRNA-2-methylthio-N6-dimethylallyladenosine synthase
MIAVGGCVASQEGAAIVERAPYVDVVFGPQTLHRLPELLERRRASGKPQVDISFPEIEKFDRLPPAQVNGVTAFVSIMEAAASTAASASCRIRAARKSVAAVRRRRREIAGLTEQGVREVTLLGQNVNAWCGTIDGAPADFASCSTT